MFSKVCMDGQRQGAEKLGAKKRTTTHVLCCQPLDRHVLGSRCGVKQRILPALREVVVRVRSRDPLRAKARLVRNEGDKTCLGTGDERHPAQPVYVLHAGGVPALRSDAHNPPSALWAIYHRMKGKSKSLLQ